MPIVAAVLGVLAGAIVNGLADALPLHRRPQAPRCFHCGAPRPRREWLALTGRACRYCGRSRGVRPALVEVAAGVLALWLALRDPSPAALIPAAVVAFVFLLITVIDIEHRLILRVVVLPSALVIGGMNLLNPARGPVKTLAGGAAGLLILGLMYWLGLGFSRWLSRRRPEAAEEVAFGFGDVMLGGLLGLAVGWPGVLVAIVFGVLFAGAASLAYLGVMLVRRRYTPFAAIPYGPWLILGASVVYFGGRTALESLLGA